jgi:hypothetical protein
VLRDAPFAVMVVDHRRGSGPGAAFWSSQEDTSERSGRQELTTDLKDCQNRRNCQNCQNLKTKTFEHGGGEGGSGGKQLHRGDAGPRKSF